MKLPGLKVLAPALALALLLPGLVAAPPACAMASCGAAMPTGDHDCCPQAAAQISTACCKQHLEAPATATQLPEQLDRTVSLAAAAVLENAPSLTRNSPLHAAPPGSPLPLDSLAQSYILRL